MTKFNFCQKLRQDLRGAPALEFALVAPIMLLLFFGIVQFGHIYYVRSSILDLARETSRQLSTGAITAAQASSFLASHTSKQVSATPSINISLANPNENLGTVSSEYRINVTVPMSAVAMADPFGLVGEGTLDVELFFFADSALLTAQ